MARSDDPIDASGLARSLARMRAKSMLSADEIARLRADSRAAAIELKAIFAREPRPILDEDAPQEEA